MREKINQRREFGLSSLAVNNRKTVYLIITIFLVGGISAYKNMPRESFPQIQVPEIYVNVPYPGNSPEIIADKIIKPFEKELNKLKGIEKITSTATQDFGILKIEFDFGITPKIPLTEKQKSIGEITYLLGYTEPANFGRSFKKWTGQTPGAFRASA